MLFSPCHSDLGAAVAPLEKQTLVASSGEEPNSSKTSGAESGVTNKSQQLHVPTQTTNTGTSSNPDSVSRQRQQQATVAGAINTTSHCNAGRNAASLEQVHELIREIQKQLILGDSPPSNFDKVPSNLYSNLGLHTNAAAAQPTPTTVASSPASTTTQGSSSSSGGSPSATNATPTALTATPNGSSNNHGSVKIHGAGKSPKRLPKWKPHQQQSSHQGEISRQPVQSTLSQSLQNNSHPPTHPNSKKKTTTNGNPCCSSSAIESCIMMQLALQEGGGTGGYSRQRHDVLRKKQQLQQVQRQQQGHSSTHQQPTQTTNSDRTPNSILESWQDQCYQAGTDLALLFHPEHRLPHYHSQKTSPSLQSQERSFQEAVTVEKNNKSKPIHSRQEAATAAATAEATAAVKEAYKAAAKTLTLAGVTVSAPTNGTANTPTSPMRYDVTQAMATANQEADEEYEEDAQSGDTTTGTPPHEPSLGETTVRSFDMDMADQDQEEVYHQENDHDKGEAEHVKVTQQPREQELLQGQNLQAGHDKQHQQTPPPQTEKGFHTPSPFGIMKKAPSMRTSLQVNRAVGTMGHGSLVMLCAHALLQPRAPETKRASATTTTPTTAGDPMTAGARGTVERQNTTVSDEKDQEDTNAIESSAPDQEEAAAEEEQSLTFHSLHEGDDSTAFVTVREEQSSTNSDNSSASSSSPSPRRPITGALAAKLNLDHYQRHKVSSPVEEDFRSIFMSATSSTEEMGGFGSISSSSSTLSPSISKEETYAMPVRRLDAEEDGPSSDSSVEEEDEDEELDPSYPGSATVEQGKSPQGNDERHTATSSGMTNLAEDEVTVTAGCKTAGKRRSSFALYSRDANSHHRMTMGFSPSRQKQEFRHKNSDSQPRRIHMYGSEYARFLSSTPLSPAIPKKKPSLISSLTRRSREASLSQTSHHGVPISGGPSSGGGSSSSTPFSSFRTSTAIYLEEKSSSILTGAVMDLVVTHGNDLPPRGYHRISQTGNGHKADLTLGMGGSAVYLNVKKEPSWDRAVQRPCVVALALIFPDRNEFVPPGFCVVRRYKYSKPSSSFSSSSSSPLPSSATLNALTPAAVKLVRGGGGSSEENHASSNAGSSGDASTPRGRNDDSPSTSNPDDAAPANLNSGSGGERVYLCYKRSREGNPITGIIPLQPTKNEFIPEGYTVLERTPRNFVADLNMGAGPPLFLAFRQRLANLETLRPVPLLLNQQGSQSTRLSHYFCTGGTTVKSDVGAYHIMDRSAHPRVSPSSVATRLSLVHSTPTSSYKPSYSNRNIRKSPANSAGARSPSPVSVALTVESIQSFGLDGIPHGHEGLDFDVSSDASLSSYSAKGSLPSVRSLPSPLQYVRSSSSVSSWNAQVASFMSMEFIPFIVDGSKRPADPARVAALTPILTSCYTLHGGAALMAVEGLSLLLHQTDFFLVDRRRPKKRRCSSNVDKNNASARSHAVGCEGITLLDLAVQVACDVATSTARETHFGPSVEFACDAMTYTDGLLNNRTLGHILRLNLFVCYFGASVPTSSSWPETLPLSSFMNDDGVGRTSYSTADSTLHSSWTPSRVKTDPPLLLDRQSARVRIGAPHASALALRDMTSFILERLDSGICACEQQPVHQEGESTTDFIRGIVSSLVDTSVHRVNVANFTQLALHQIERGGGSELFWHDMTNTCGKGLFGESCTEHVVAFSMLSALVKVATARIRRVQDTTTFVPRDVAAKLLSLELLLHYVKVLAKLRDFNSSKSCAVLIYAVRRLVVPCILSNAANGFDDPRVFRRMLYIITSLWTNYRKFLKVEIAALFQHFVLQTLRMGPQVFPGRRCRLDQQLDVLTEIIRWFETPQDTLEIFLNYDADDKSTWNIFQQMCSALCTLAEQCGEITSDPSFAHKGGNGGKLGGGVGGESNRTREAARTLQEQSFNAICHLVRSLKEASWHIYMMSTGGVDLTPLKGASSSVAGRGPPTLSKDKSYPNFLSTPPRTNDVKKAASNDSSSSRRRSSYAAATHDTTSALKPALSTKRRSSFGQLQHSSSGDLSTEAKSAGKILDVAFEIVKEKGLKKALDYLIACNMLTPSARDVASFLRMHRNRLDPSVLGMFLGEGHRSDGDYWNLIRYHYVRATSFVDMNVEQGLRHFLTSCGFRLPGEAQQVDRIITTFAQCFWEDNAGDHARCPFQSQETVFLLSFAIIMLNTDLHKVSPNDASSNSTTLKKRKKMTRQEFLNNLKGAINSEDVSKEYMFRIYDSIDAQPIKIHHSLDIQAGAYILFGHSGSGSSPPRGSASPPEQTQTSSNATLYTHSTKSLTSGIKSTQELLRGFALYEEKCVELGQDSLLSRSLVRRVLSATWFHFHGIVNAMLESPQRDQRPHLVPCLNLLQSTIGATILLDMRLERTAFLKQLAQIKFIFERGVSYQALNLDAKSFVNKKLYRKEQWYLDIGSGTVDSKEGPVHAIESVHSLVVKMRSSLQLDPQTINDLHRVVRRIRHGAFLLRDENRSFIREGDLTKRCRNRRYVTYRFFLFSDRLLYARYSSAHDDYKIHEDLPLSAMKILNVENRKGDNNAFVVVHPTKSFTVIASSPQSKSYWMRDISIAVEKSIERYSRVLGAGRDSK